jgi:hypothetical protein
MSTAPLPPLLGTVPQRLVRHQIYAPGIAGDLQTNREMQGHGSGIREIRVRVRVRDLIRVRVK